MEKPGIAVHRATDRVLDVLETLAATGETSTLALLSARLAVPKSSLLPLLRTLVARRWIEQPSPAHYRIAPDRLASARMPAERLDLPKVARPFMVKLTETSGESSFLGVLPASGDAIVYIEKVESRQVIRYTADLGESRPLHCTALGLAVLAFLPKARRDEIVRGIKLQAYTPRTTTSRKELERRLESIARAGVATTMEEFVPGASAIAAPVFNRSGEVAGACALAGPADRMRAARGPYIEAVKSSAIAISAAMGWRP